MTKEQVIAALAKYEARLSLHEPYNPKCADPTIFHRYVDRMEHVMWMCSEARKHLEADKVEKAMRWLGFIQGVLWADWIFTVEEMKDDNR